MALSYHPALALSFCLSGTDLQLGLWPTTLIYPLGLALGFCFSNTDAQLCFWLMTLITLQRWHLSSILPILTLSSFLGSAPLNPALTSKLNSRFNYWD